jgi:predicted Zn-ribbon and HTH transcriptional regulator
MKRPKLSITSATLGEKADANSAFADEDAARREQLDRHLELTRPWHTRTCVDCGADFRTRNAARTKCPKCMDTAPGGNR